MQRCTTCDAPLSVWNVERAGPDVEPVVVYICPDRHETWEFRRSAGTWRRRL
jgi:hypothetical protein